MGSTPLINLRNFIMQEAPPLYHYKQNIIEGVATLTLFPTQWAVGLYETPKSNEPIWIQVAIKAVAVVTHILCLPLTILGITLRLAGRVLPHPYFEKLTEAEVVKTSEIKSSQIYDILEIFNNICSENKINYWMDAGTLLGSERHKGMIPWDDDADVCIYSGQEDNFTLLLEKFDESGLQVTSPHTGLYQIWFKEAAADRENRGHLDVFIYDWVETEEGERRLMSNSPEFRAIFPGQYYIASDFGLNNGEEDSLTAGILDGSIFSSYQFGPPNPITGAQIKLSGIANQEAWAKRYYGDDCMEFGINSHNHFSLGCCSVPFPVLSKYRYEIENYDAASWIDWRNKSDEQDNLQQSDVNNILN